jgi:hypothetical protein
MDKQEIIIALDCITKRIEGIQKDFTAVIDDYQKALLKLEKIRNLFNLLARCELTEYEVLCQIESIIKFN